MTNPQRIIVDAKPVPAFDTMKRVRDDLNAQCKRLEKPERYRIRFARGALQLEQYQPNPKQASAASRETQPDLVE
jgi:hypothetical protein